MISGDCPTELNIYPNPYFPGQGTRAKFLLETSSNGSLEIFNFSGKKVDDVECSSTAQPGYLVCFWDGYDKSNQSVANGVYFCKISVSGQAYWQKLGLVNIK